jgi:putative membrane protein
VRLMSFNRLNVQRLIRSLILLLFALLILKKTESGEILLYIHPRFIMTARFTYVVLFLLTAVETSKIRLKNGNGKDIIKPLTIAVFIAPILLGYLMPPTALDSAAARKKGGLNIESQRVSEKKRSAEASKSSKTTAKTTAQKDMDRTERLQDKTSDNCDNNDKNVLDITDDNFVFTIDKINNDPDKMKDKIVRLKGFIYKEDDFTREEFALVRFTVMCCTADAVALGLTFKYPKAQLLKEDNWYEITGKVTANRKRIEEMDADLPILDVLDVKKVKAPKDQYVYPDWSQYNTGN